MADSDVGSVAPAPASLAESICALWEALPKRTLRVALAFDGALLALYVIGVLFAYQNPNLFFLLDLEAEGNPPSWWYGSQQLLLALAFLLLASRLFDRIEDIRRFRALFLVSAIGFGFVSLDEVGEVHEIGSRILVDLKFIGHAEQWFEQSVLHIKHRLHGGGIWIAVYALIGVVLLFWLVPQIIRAYKVWSRQVTTVAVGFGIFAFSAAVLQVVGYFTKRGTAAHFIYVFTEQALKMVGISIALYGVVQVVALGLTAVTRALADEVP
jgi:hypothetical protein